MSEHLRRVLGQFEQAGDLTHDRAEAIRDAHDRDVSAHVAAQLAAEKEIRTLAGFVLSDYAEKCCDHLDRCDCSMAQLHRALSDDTGSGDTCWMPCDPDCEYGPIHCANFHLPVHKWLPHHHPGGRTTTTTPGSTEGQA